jgi:hypothetical protein
MISMKRASIVFCSSRGLTGVVGLPVTRRLWIVSNAEGPSACAARFAGSPCHRHHVHGEQRRENNQSDGNIVHDTCSA